MVRKGTRVLNKRACVVPPALPTMEATPPAITYGGTSVSGPGGIHHHHHPYGNGIMGGSGGGPGAKLAVASSSSSVSTDDETCPQCGVAFNTTNFRKLQEECGHYQCRNCVLNSERCKLCFKEGSVIVEEAATPPQLNHNHSRSVNTRRSAAAAAARLQSATNSRGNSINSVRPTSSSPGSTSNDTGRQSSSVYSDSADSDSCLRFPTSVIGTGGGVVEVNDVNDGYPATIDFETMAELTSPTLVDTGYMGLSEFSAAVDSKSYSSIVSEENEFSKSLMSLRKMADPNLNNNHNNGCRTSPVSLGTNSHRGLVTRAQLKEMPSLSVVTIAGSTATTSQSFSNQSSSLPSGSSRLSGSSKRRSKDSPIAVVEVGSNGGNGSGSPDITRPVSKDLPRRLASKDNSPPIEVGSSRLSALLRSGTTQKNTRSSTGAEQDSQAKATPATHSNRESGEKEIPIGELASESSKTTTISTPSIPADVKKESEPVPSPPEASNSAAEEVEQNIDEVEQNNDEGEQNNEEKEEDPLAEKEPVPKKKKKRSPVVIHDHITILGGETPMYQCNLCNKKFKTKAHIKYHEFCQKGDKPFKCETCGQGFIAKSHYEYHIRTHTGERPYTCPKCGKGFNQQGKVTRHMRSHTGEKPFVCQECNRGFANAQALRCHTLIHTGERPFACTYCNKRFTGMTNLKKHVITHTGERPFSCTHCGKSFGLKWTLDLHLRTHSTERPYACDQCTRAFSNSKDLRRHLVIHSGERPFKCWLCGTAFRRKDNLDRHIKNTHNQTREVAKQLANEAAAEYLKNNSKNHTLGNIPVSKVNSIVISNIIKNNDLMPAGGLGPNKFKGVSVDGVGGSGSGSSSNVSAQRPIQPKPAVKVSSPSAKAASPVKFEAKSATSSSTPSSVQQTKPSSSTNTTNSSRQRKVISTAPLSPPTTRAGKSKQTDVTSPSKVISPKKVKTSPKVKRKAPVAATASSQPTTNSDPEPLQVVILPPPPPPVEVSNETVKKSKRKSKKKKKSKSKSSHREEEPHREVKRQERVRAPPSPPIVEFPTKRFSRSRNSGGSKQQEAKVEEEAERKIAPTPEPPPPPPKETMTLSFIDIERRPILTLVTPPSPKVEEREGMPTTASSSDIEQVEEKQTEEKDCSHEGEVQEKDTEKGEDKNVECILPHDISEVDEEMSNDPRLSDSTLAFLNDAEIGLRVDSQYGQEDVAQDSTEEKTEEHEEKVEEKAPASSKQISSVEDLPPVSSQPPEQLFDDEDECEESAFESERVETAQNSGDDMSEIDPTPITEDVTEMEVDKPCAEVEEAQSDGEWSDVSSGSFPCLPPSALPKDEEIEENQVESGALEGELSEGELNPDENDEETSTGPLLSSSAALIEPTSPALCVITMTSTVAHPANRPTDPDIAPSPPRWEAPTSRLILVPHDSPPPSSTHHATSEDEVEQTEKEPPSAVLHASIEDEKVENEPPSADLHVGSEDEEKKKEQISSALHAGSEDEEKEMEPPGAALHVSSEDEEMEPPSSALHASSEDGQVEKEPPSVEMDVNDGYPEEDDDHDEDGQLYVDESYVTPSVDSVKSIVEHGPDSLNSIAEEKAVDDENVYSPSPPPPSPSLSLKAACSSALPTSTKISAPEETSPPSVAGKDAEEEGPSLPPSSETAIVAPVSPKTMNSTSLTSTEAELGIVPTTPPQSSPPVDAVPAATSSQPTTKSDSEPLQVVILPPPPPPVEASNEIVKKSKRKSKKKKKSKSSHMEVKSQERVRAPASPSVVEFPTKRFSRSRNSGENKQQEAKVEEEAERKIAPTPEPPPPPKETMTLSFIDMERRPILTLVTPPSPKVEEREGMPTTTSSSDIEQTQTGEKDGSHEGDVQVEKDTEKGEDKNVECILHDISEVDEEMSNDPRLSDSTLAFLNDAEIGLKVDSQYGEEDFAQDSREDKTEEHEETAPPSSKQISSVEDLPPVSSQPPEQLFDDEDECEESAFESERVETAQNSGEDMFEIDPTPITEDVTEMEVDKPCAEVEETQSDGEWSDVSSGSFPCLPPSALPEDEEMEETQVESGALEGELSEGELNPDENDEETSTGPLLSSSAALVEPASPTLCAVTMTSTVVLPANRPTDPDIAPSPPRWEAPTPRLILVPHDSPPPSSTHHARNEDEVEQTEKEPPSAVLHASIEDEKVGNEPPSAELHVSSEEEEKKKEPPSSALHAGSEDEEKEMEPPSAALHVSSDDEDMEPSSSALHESNEDEEMEMELPRAALHASSEDEQVEAEPPSADLHASSEDVQVEKEPKSSALHVSSKDEEKEPPIAVLHASSEDEEKEMEPQSAALHVSSEDEQVEKVLPSADLHVSSVGEEKEPSIAVLHASIEDEQVEKKPPGAALHVSSEDEQVEKEPPCADHHASSVDEEKEMDPPSSTLHVSSDDEQVENETPSSALHASSEDEQVENEPRSVEMDVNDGYPEEDDDDEDRLYVDESYVTPSVDSVKSIVEHGPDSLNSISEEKAVDDENVYSPSSPPSLSLEAACPAALPTTTKISAPEETSPPSVAGKDAEEEGPSSPPTSKTAIVAPVSPKTMNSTSSNSTEKELGIVSTTPPRTPSPTQPSPPVVAVPVDTDEENSRSEATLPQDISDFVLSVLENKSRGSGAWKADDLESISSESLASPQSDVENSIKMCIQTLESDPEEDGAPSIPIRNIQCDGVSLAMSLGPLPMPASMSNSNISSRTTTVTSSCLVVPISKPEITVPPPKSPEIRSEPMKPTLESSPPPSLEESRVSPVPSGSPSPNLTKNGIAPASPDQPAVQKSGNSSPALSNVESESQKFPNPAKLPPVPEYKLPPMVPQEEVLPTTAVQALEKSAEKTVSVPPPKISSPTNVNKKPVIAPVSRITTTAPPTPTDCSATVSFATTIPPVMKTIESDMPSPPAVVSISAPSVMTRPVVSATPAPLQNIRPNGLVPQVSLVSNRSNQCPVPEELAARPRTGEKRGREELYQALPTRVQFLLPNGQQHQSIQLQPDQQLVSFGTEQQQQQQQQQQLSLAPVAYDPSLLSFMQPNGQQALEGNYQIVYAAAAATAERDEGVLDGPPNKVRLLYAEALGVGSSPQNGDELQFYYAATTPDQQVQHTSTPCHVQLMEPYRVTYSRTADNATSEMLQYQVQQQAQPYQQPQSTSNLNSQQVLNLSVNNSPVYYYSTQNNFEQHQQQQSSSNHQPQQQIPYDQQQQQGTYYNTSTAKLIVANQAAYNSVGAPPTQADQRHHSHVRNGEAQDLRKRLELPVQMAQNNKITYAHVQSQDPNRYADLLGKARQMKHVFPEGALRHYNSYQEYRSSGASHHHPYHQTTTINGMDTAGFSNDSRGNGPSGSGAPKLSGLDLLSAASLSLDELQDETHRTHAAAAAIAAVGEIARRRRLGGQQQQQEGGDREVAAPRPPLPNALHQNYPMNHQNNVSAPYHPQQQQQQQPQQIVRMGAALPGQQFLPQNQQPLQGHQQYLRPQQPAPVHAHHLHPQVGGLEVVGNVAEVDQEAGIRRGPRKYYLSRSAHLRN